MIQTQMKLIFFIYFLSIPWVFPQNDSIKREKIAKVRSFADGKKEAEKIILSLIHKGTVPGVAITITKKNKTLWQQGYGFADLQHKTPVSPQKTLFRIASVSKPMSATTLAKLQEKKKFDWNKSIYTYLPNYPKKKHDFTIKQLGGHLAGIRSYKGREPFSNKPMTIEQGINMFKNESLLSVPGTQYLYSSFNWNLISLAMQKYLKKSFENIVSDELLKPLQMKNTLPDKGKIIKNQAIPYSNKNKGKGFVRSPDVNNFYKLAGGGYLSTSEDVAKFGNAVLSDEFISQKIKEEMLMPQQTTAGSSTGCGIGWQSTKDWAGRTYYGHSGNGIGGYAWFFVYPEEQVVVVMLFNMTNPKISQQLRDVIDFILAGSKFIYM
ncbi:serine hydrolase domain-containing protein [Capnocytophaga canis]